MTEILKKLESLYCHMRCTRIFMRFLRNNPRYTNRYYQKFIEIIGTDEYLKSPLVKLEWDSAKNSFDKMYGLVSSWRKGFSILETDEKAFTVLHDAINSLSKEIDSLPTLIDIDEAEILSLLKSADDADAKKLLNSYIDFLDKTSDIGKENTSGISALISLINKVERTTKIIEIYKQKVDLSKTAQSLKEKEEAKKIRELEKSSDDLSESIDSFVNSYSKEITSSLATDGENTVEERLRHYIKLKESNGSDTLSNAICACEKAKIIIKITQHKNEGESKDE